MRAVYSTGKFTVSGAVGGTSYAAGDVRRNNAGASYDFGVVNVMGMYEWDKRGTVSARGWLAGALVPVGVGYIRAAYSRYGTDAAGSPTAKKWAVGYVYLVVEAHCLVYGRRSRDQRGPVCLGLERRRDGPGPILQRIRLRDPAQLLDQLLVARVGEQLEHAGQYPLLRCPFSSAMVLRSGTISSR